MVPLEAFMLYFSAFSFVFINDTDNNDLVNLTESIIETKITLQKMVYNITELEHIVYLSRRGKNIFLYEN